MANMQRMLGTLLASRMAGRGRMGGALGTASMLGGRRGGGGLGRTAGLATLGYLAYQAVNQNRAGQQAPTGTATSGTGGGGLGGILDSLSGRGQSSGGASPSLGERIGNALNPRAAEPAPTEGELSDAKALLLIRAMITAANSDGNISPQERERIVAKLDEAGADAEDHRLLEQELLNPQSLDILLRSVNDPETAQQFYLASRTAVDPESPTQEAYLSFLRSRLQLADAEAEEVDEIAT